MPPKTLTEKRLTQPPREQLVKKPEVLPALKVADRLIESVLKSRGQRRAGYVQELKNMIGNLVVSKEVFLPSVKKERDSLEDDVELLREKNSQLQHSLGTLKSSVLELQHYKRLYKSIK